MAPTTRGAFRRMNECRNKRVSQFVLDQLDIEVGLQNRLLVVCGCSNNPNKVKMVAAVVARIQGVSISKRCFYLYIIESMKMRFLLMFI